MSDDVGPTNPLQDSAVPLYVQLERIFREKLRQGRWSPGDRIPSENELKRVYRVSRMTVRGVLTKLADEGLLVRVAGRGTFVVEPKIPARSPAYQGVREQLESMGMETTTDLIRLEREAADPSVRHHLQLQEGDMVLAVERLRTADGIPLSIHYSYVPETLAPTLDQHDPASEQLCVILDTNFGLQMKHVEERLESVAANTSVARKLGISRGAPILQLEDVISDATHKPFEYSVILFRGDKVQLHFDYVL